MLAISRGDLIFTGLDPLKQTHKYAITETELFIWVLGREGCDAPYYFEYYFHISPPSNNNLENTTLSLICLRESRDETKRY